MLTISIANETEDSIRRLAELSGVSAEDVARVLLALPLDPAHIAPILASPTDIESVNDEEFHRLINSLGHRIQSSAPTLAGVDLRELAYDQVGE